MSSSHLTSHAHDGDDELRELRAKNVALLYERERHQKREKQERRAQKEADKRQQERRAQEEADKLQKERQDRREADKRQQEKQAMEDFVGNIIKGMMEAIDTKMEAGNTKMEAIQSQLEALLVAQGDTRETVEHTKKLLAELHETDNTLVYFYGKFSDSLGNLERSLDEIKAQTCAVLNDVKKDGDYSEQLYVTLRKYNETTLAQNKAAFDEVVGYDGTFMHDQVQDQYAGIVEMFRAGIGGEDTPSTEDVERVVDAEFRAA